MRRIRRGAEHENGIDETSTWPVAPGRLRRGAGCGGGWLGRPAARVVPWACGTLSTDPEIRHPGSMKGCSFCAIVRGEGTVHAVFETADVLAFFPLASAAVGHTLVIPKTHIPDIWSLVDAQASSLMISTL